MDEGWGRVIRDDVVPGRTQVFREVLYGFERVLGHWARAIIADHVDDVQPCVRPYCNPGRAAQHRVGSRCCGDDHHDALGGIPDDVGVPGDEEPEQLLFGLIGDKTKRELAQRHEVLIAEEAGEGTGDLLGRVYVAM